jgi:transcriptional regulator with XRE-family HTH domain
MVATGVVVLKQRDQVLGTRLRDARLKKGITQGDLGRLLGIDNTTVSSYERGITQPDPITIGRLADALSVSTDYLVGRVDNPQGVARATPPDEQAGDELVVMFRGKRQQLTPEYQRMLIKLMEAAAEDEAEKAKKSQP